MTGHGLEKIKEFSEYQLKRILAVFHLADLKEKIKGKIKECSEYHPRFAKCLSFMWESYALIVSQNTGFEER